MERRKKVGNFIGSLLRVCCIHEILLYEQTCSYSVYRQFLYSTANRGSAFMAVLLYKGKKYSVNSWLSGRLIISCMMLNVAVLYSIRPVLTITWHSRSLQGVRRTQQLQISHVIVELDRGNGLIVCIKAGPPT